MCGGPLLPTVLFLLLPEDFDPWLIRFLIGSKNSLQRAKEYMEKYCTSRAQRADLFTQAPSPVVDRLFNLMYVLVQRKQQNTRKGPFPLSLL